MSRRKFLVGGSALLPMLVVGRAAAQDTEPTESDIGYCRDMSVHHLQALDMCQRVLGHDTGGSVQAAAAEVLQNQAIEVGLFWAWLGDWDASTVPPETVMAWMGANGGAGIPLASMPGYASPEELLELSTLSGLDRGRRWLQLMRAHHVAGVTMATRATELASAHKVVRLAARQAEIQAYEIYQYDQLLAGPYA